MGFAATERKEGLVVPVSADWEGRRVGLAVVGLNSSQDIEGWLGLTSFPDVTGPVVAEAGLAVSSRAD